MKIAHALMALILSVLFTGLIMGLATANVPGVAINAPPPPPAPNVATAGSDVTIKVTVTHRDTGAPALHYVDRVMLYDGDKLLKEWKYDQNNYKKDEVWTESYTGTANSDMRLRAVAHCTVHGYELTGVHMRVLPTGIKPSDMMKTDASYAGMQAFGYSDAKKASDYLSSADSKFLDGIIKAQSSDLKSFQGKLSDWMKSSEGQQFISQRDQQMARPTTRMLQAIGDLRRQPAKATMRANASAMPTTKVRRSVSMYVAATMKPGDAGNIPRVSAIATPTPVAGGRGKGGVVTSPKATLRASPTVKYLQARPVATMRASPTRMANATPKVKSPAESYGIYGLGGPVPSPPKSTVTARPVPSGSPTPVPGGFTPRFPGEPGAGKGSPTPTVAPKVSPPPTPQVMIPMPAPGGTAGMAVARPLTDESRYAARGPGLVNGVMVYPPMSAPGRMA
jgi:desulfoferrodoxin (superoxide reductase-like protein)